MPRKPAPASRAACPECNSRDVVPVVYGLPGPEAVNAVEAGRIELGGCVVSTDDPVRHCKTCGHRWR